MKLSKTEREIFEHGLASAKKRLIIAKQGKVGTVRYESARNIEAHIQYLQKALEEDDKKTE